MMVRVSPGMAADVCYSMREVQKGYTQWDAEMVSPEEKEEKELARFGVDTRQETLYPNTRTQ